ncbi:MAG: hypothetical protein IKA89_06750 [Anaerotignum sp.]|nr:hypothetical protein [Anaerotignum sp.]
MTGFFLPWNEDRTVKKGEKKLHLPKRDYSLEDAVFDNRKPAYVSLPNPRGTLRSFLQAVESGKKEEAMGYFSTKIAEVVDYEELEGYLKDLKDYYCFAEDEGKGIRRVSVAKKNNKDEEIFSFRMVAEPDSFGKWKIFSIEREGKE